MSANYLLNPGMQQLEQIAVGNDAVLSLANAIQTIQAIEAMARQAGDGNTQVSLSNIGNIGIAPDFSNNQLASPLQNDFPLVRWLLNTMLSSQMRNTNREGLVRFHLDADGQWVMQLPYKVWTEAIPDTTGACCWIPPDINKCAKTAPINLLCLKDCDTLLNNLINKMRYAGSNDLISYFQRRGESVFDARRRLARLTMAYLTARNIILGVSDAGTATLKPFHGLLEILEGDDVIKIDGSNILAAFASLWCRLSVLEATSGNYVFAVHPLVYEGIAKAVQPGRFGDLPDGWTKNGDEVRFHGIRFIRDKIVPVDMTTGTGEIWVLDGETLGAFMATDLAPTDSFIYDDIEHNDVPADGCAVECMYMYNFGTVFNTNSNRLAVITNVSINSACTGAALQGLDSIITPETLVPYL